MAAHFGNSLPDLRGHSKRREKRQVTENTGTPPATPPATDPPPATTPPPADPPPATTRTPSTNDGSVLAAVNALPEKLVDAVRELIPQQAPASTPPQQPQQTPPTTTPPASAGTNQPEVKKRRTFGEVWFGLNR